MSSQIGCPSTFKRIYLTNQLLLPHLKLRLLTVPKPQNDIIRP